MVTTGYALEKRARKKDGTYPVKVYFSFNKRQFWVGTNISVTEKEWAIMQSRPTKQMKSALQVLTSKKAYVDGVLASLEVSGKLFEMSSREIAAAVNTNIHQEDFSNEVETFFCKVRDGKKKPKTVSVYNQTLRLLGKQVNLKKFKWSDVTYNFLKDWETSLSETRNVNGVSVPLRTFRAVYYEALRQGCAEGQNVFYQFKIKSAATIHRSLSVKELRKLRDMKLDEHGRKYVDIFFLSFYLLGINMVDLLNLTHDDVHEGRIHFIRSKTGKPFSIKIEPEAQAIIDKYKGTHYLLNILERYSNYDHFIRNMNDGLKLVGTVYRNGLKRTGKPLFPHLSSYWARHSWATLAADLEINESTISFALGHSLSNRVTSIYIRPNQKKVDAANRRLIDFLNGTEEIEW